MMALVREVIAASIAVGSMQSVCGRMSTNTGLAPDWAMASAVA